MINVAKASFPLGLMVGQYQPVTYNPDFGVRIYVFDLVENCQIPAFKHVSVSNLQLSSLSWNVRQTLGCLDDCAHTTLGDR